MGDIMISFEFMIKKDFPWFNLEKKAGSEIEYLSEKTAVAYVMYARGWNAGERG